MAEQITPFEYVDKAFGFNLVQAFSIDPTHMPKEIQSFLARDINKKIHFGGIEKQGAKAFRTMVEKRSPDKKSLPSPLIVVHREVGSTNDKYEYFSDVQQYQNILQAFKAQVAPKTFSFTIQIFARSDQRGILDFLHPMVDIWLREHSSITVPHVINWTEEIEGEDVEQQEELQIPLDLNLTDIQNPAWVPVVDGHYLGVERGQDANTYVVLSNMIAPAVIDFNFVGVESL